MVLFYKCINMRPSMSSIVQMFAVTTVDKSMHRYKDSTS